MDAPKPQGFNEFDNLMRKLVKVKPDRLLLTKAQRIVLDRLSADGWVIDRYGQNGMQSRMSGPGWKTFIISAKTISFLLSEELIATSISGITDFEITAKGREAIS